MPLATLTFDSLVTSLIQRSGRDKLTPTIADYPDLQAILNHRLQEIWDYPGNGWDFLKEIAILNKTDVLFATGFELAGTDEFYRKNALQVNGRNAYTYIGDQTIEWDGVSKWQVFGADDAVVYEAEQDVATPDLVSEWTRVGAAAIAMGAQPDAMVVEGADDDTYNTVYPRNGDSDGKPKYLVTGSLEMSWVNTSAFGDNRWLLSDQYFGDEDVATPDLVDTWQLLNATAGTPTVRYATWADIDAAGIDRSTVPLLAGSYEPVAAGTVVIGNYHSIDISDGKQVLGVWPEDPRQNPTAPMLRTEVLVGGELRVPDSADDKIYYAYTPERPDWISDSPVPTVYKVWRAAAIELAYADMQGQKNDANPGQVQQLEQRGYRMLDELCNRYARHHTMPTVGISRSQRYYRSV